MKLRLTRPPLAWIDETWPEGIASAFSDVTIAFEGGKGAEPPCVTVGLGGYAVSLSFPLIEALARLAAGQDGYDAAHLAQMENGDVLEIGQLPARPPVAFDVIEGGRA